MEFWDKKKEPRKRLNAEPIAIALPDNKIIFPKKYASWEKPEPIYQDVKGFVESKEQGFSVMVQDTFAGPIAVNVTRLLFTITPQQILQLRYWNIQNYIEDATGIVAIMPGRYLFSPPESMFPQTNEFSYIGSVSPSSPYGAPMIFYAGTRRNEMYYKAGHCVLYPNVSYPVYLTTGVAIIAGQTCRSMIDLSFDRLS